jgi:adenylate cyclase
VSSDKRRAVFPSPPPPAIREIKLIDRVEEMRILREAVDRSLRGEGGVVFLYGEAGIGKTRLARELGAYALSRGMQVLSGRCPALFRMDGVPPYVLWEEVIKDYMDICTFDELHRVIGSYPIEVSKLIPELKQKLRIVPESFPLSPEHSRDRLFEAVAQFITNISREKPLLVILDDLQWTDQSSLLLMHYLARGVYRESLLLLGAYRETYVDDQHPLSPVLTELNRERLLQSVPLKRLSFDDTAEMIKRILEQDEMPKEFCKVVYEKTRGNPFFAEEVIRSLKEEEVIYREKNQWKIKEVSRIEFPKTVKSVIKKRISRLDDECQHVLTLASFVGKDFTFEALRGVAGVEEEKLLEIIEKMFKTGLLKHTVVRGEDMCSFADIIVRDVVHEEVNPFRRKKLHSVVGNALEKVYAEMIDEHLGELALHFLESGDRTKALDYFLKAGEKAANVYANNEAASYFQSALKLLEEVEGELHERGLVLERLGDIKRLVGEYEVCMKFWNEALLLWKQLNEKGNVSRLHRKMANVLWNAMSEANKAKEHHGKALKILEAKPESVELASLYEDIAHMYYRIGDMAKALPWAEKALELAKKLNDSEVIASSYASLGAIFSSTGDRKKGREFLERALKIALDRGYMETALRCYVNLGVKFPGEESERSSEYNEKGSALAKKVGHIFYQSAMGTSLAFMYILMGDMNKAILLAEESVALDRKTGNMFTLPRSLLALGLAYQILAEWKKSEQYYNEALSVSQKINVFWPMTYGYACLGWLHLNKGEYVRAREHLEKAIEVFGKAGAKNSRMWSSRFLIWTYIELGEIEKARNLLDKLHKFALQVKNKAYIAEADALRAMVFRAQKKWKKSIEHFEKSLKIFESLNARQWNVYWFTRMVLFEYARVYLERDREGDREKAYKLLDQALELFRKMGAKKDIEKTRSKLTHLESGREMVEPKPLTEVALPTRISIGYGDIDDLLFGGIPRDYAVILTSPSCDERDLLIKRFLETGAEKGEITFYITIDPSQVKSLTEECQSNFYLFVCNPEADAITKSLPNVYMLKGVENLNDVNITLASAFHRIEKSPKTPRRICIEIVSDILLQHHAVSTRRWLTALIPKLKSRGFTTLAVMDPEIHPQQEVRAIIGVFDGEINIYDKETKKGLRKHLKIRKMTHQKYSENELPLRKEKL